MTAAGYSGTPLAKKLGIKEAQSIALLGAPRGFVIEDLPAGVAVRTAARGRNDVIVSFHEWRAELEDKVPKLLAGLDVNGGLWIAWPKKSSGDAGDLTMPRIVEMCAAYGLAAYKSCAVRISKRS